jgi:glycosyltransferase involved in cell wall biosynthesis
MARPPAVGGPISGVVKPTVSVVLPCLDEAASVGLVVADALRVMREHAINGEVVVADNGSTDGSAEIAAEAGARVVVAPARGYGNAYHAGMAAAEGRVLVMADGDGTYPMEAIPELVEPILGGTHDMVIGSRLKGRIHAMPWTHRYIGNPILTGMLNRFFRIRVSDAHSGMRAIDRCVYQRLGLSTPGMEYASEMIVQAARARTRILEIPIEYRERIGESKLDTWPDGWRHLKFLLLASPTWLYLIPGLVSMFVGLLFLVPLTFGPVNIGPIHFVLHPIIFGAVCTIVGYQMLLTGALLRACQVQPEGVRDRLADFVHRRLTLERVLVAGMALVLAGVALGIAIFVYWAAHGFNELFEIRQSVTALTMFVVGTETIMGAFLYAFFLPPQFGGGIACATTARRTMDVRGVAVAEPATDLKTTPIRTARQARQSRTKPVTSAGMAISAVSTSSSSSQTAAGTPPDT